MGIIHQNTPIFCFHFQFRILYFDENCTYIPIVKRPAISFLSLTCSQEQTVFFTRSHKIPKQFWWEKFSFIDTLILQLLGCVQNLFKLYCIVYNNDEKFLSTKIIILVLLQMDILPLDLDSENT